jgi:protein involved in polysaccharide export with SLBB domain
MRNSIQDNSEGPRVVVTARNHPAAVSLSGAVRFLALAGLSMGLAFAQGCAKQVPPQGTATPGTEPPAQSTSLEKAPNREPQAEPTPKQPSEPTSQQAAEPAPKQPAEPAGGRIEPQSARQLGPRISTYYLSSGDEIKVSVFGYPELERTLKIPPDGHMFYPMVGDISVDGLSIPELRQILTDKLKTADDQKIASGDQLSVRVYRQDDLTITTVVPSSGVVNLPLAGEVDLRGLTVEAANQAVAEKLRPYVVKPSVTTTILKSVSGLPGRITDPHVSVEVLAFGGHKILVLGEVEKPGVYVNEGGSRVLDVLARAGGPTHDAKLRSVALVRPATETSPARNALLDLDRALKNGEWSQNPPVQKGDVIYVPKSTMASVAQFFAYVYAIVRPLVTIETGIWLGQNIDAGPRRVGTTGAVVFE